MWLVGSQQRAGSCSSISVSITLQLLPCLALTPETPRNSTRLVSLCCCACVLVLCVWLNGLSAGSSSLGARGCRDTHSHITVPSCATLALVCWQAEADVIAAAGYVGTLCAACKGFFTPILLVCMPCLVARAGGLSACWVALSRVSSVSWLCAAPALLSHTTQPLSLSFVVACCSRGKQLHWAGGCVCART